MNEVMNVKEKMIVVYYQVMGIHLLIEGIYMIKIIY